MKKRIFHYSAVLLVAFCSKVFGQENLNFSSMSFQNWDLSLGYGYTLPDITTTEYKVNSPHYDARHNINVVNGFDINTLSKLRFIPEGETCSVRLGNSNNGSQSEKLAYTFTVDSENAKGSIYYKYALVFQNSLIDKSPHVQPKFKINVYLNGELIEESYEVNASTNDSEFNSVSLPNRLIKWKDWTTVNFDLSDFNINNQIRLEFENYDCAIGRSFGYMYLVANYTEPNKVVTGRIDTNN